MCIQDPEGHPRRERSDYLEAKPKHWQYADEDKGKGDPRIEQTKADQQFAGDAKNDDYKQKKPIDGKAPPAPPVYRVLEEKWNMRDYQWQAVQPSKAGGRSNSVYAFCVHRRQTTEGGIGTHKVMIRIMSPALAKVLQKLVDPHDRLYDSVPFLPINHIYASRSKIEAWLAQYEEKDAVERKVDAGVDGVQDAQTATVQLNKLSTEQLAKAAEAIRHLLNAMHDEFADTMRKYRDLIADVLITYDLLWLMFNVDDYVVFQHEVIDQPQAMKVTSVQYVPAERDDPAYLSVRGTTLEWSGKHFFADEVRRGITTFPGVRPIHELSLHLLSGVDQDTKTAMAARGRRYTQFTDVHYKSYRGAMIRRAGCGRIVQVPCRGRVVIDRKGMVRENPNYPVSMPHTRTCERNGLDRWVAPDLDVINFKDVDYMRMPPTVYAFSLAKANPDSTEETLEVDLDITYIVHCASWTPFYDLRVFSQSDSTKLTYTANVQQSTGEDWTDVELTLSTAKVAWSHGEAPAYKTRWSLSEYRPLMPKMAKSAFGGSGRFRSTRPRNALAMPPGNSEREAFGAVMASIVGRGGSSESDEDVDGNGTDQFQTTAAEVAAGLTATAYRIPSAATIPSDDSQHRVTVALLDLPVTLDHTACPKLDPTAYLTAKITNKSAYTWLAGPANVFLDHAFVAKSRLSMVLPGAKLTTSLGPDPAVAVQYRPVEKFTESRVSAGLFTSSASDRTAITYTQRTVLENKNTTKGVTLTLADQIPTTTSSDIVVTLLDPAEKQISKLASRDAAVDTDGTKAAGTASAQGSSASLSRAPRAASVVLYEDLGVVEWKIELKPGEKREVALKYAVSYPKRITIEGLDGYLLVRGEPVS
ncbi:hypothetical protein GGF32_008403 [Allomyces javanicus]|nr:hypothetical protein GGF32_008403 [Allomyces javanicus]